MEFIATFGYLGFWNKKSMYLRIYVCTTDRKAKGMPNALPGRTCGKRNSLSPRPLLDKPLLYHLAPLRLLLMLLN